MLKTFIKEIHNVSAQGWLMAAITVVGVAVALRLVRRLLLSRRLETKADSPWHAYIDLIVQCARHTGWAFQVAMGLLVVRYMFRVPQPWDRRLAAIITVVAIIQAGVWANGVLDSLILAHFDRNGNSDASFRTGRGILRSMGLGIVWAGVALLAFENVGIHISTLVAGLGITGVAVAFATQNILSDLIASISMLLDKPFLAGDFIVVDAFMGTVERIGVRTTRLRSLSGESLVIANSDLAKSRLRNFKRMSERRVVFTFSIAYNTPTSKLRNIGGWVKEIIEAQAKTRFDRAHWLSFSDPGLVYECVFYVLDADYNLYMDIQQEINLLILDKLLENKINLAYGTQFKWIPQPQLADSNDKGSGNGRDLDESPRSRSPQLHA